MDEQRAREWLLVNGYLREFEHKESGVKLAFASVDGVELLLGKLKAAEERVRELTDILQRSLPILRNSTRGDAPELYRQVDAALGRKWGAKNEG